MILLEVFIIIFATSVASFFEHPTVLFSSVNKVVGGVAFSSQLILHELGPLASSYFLCICRCPHFHWNITSRLILPTHKASVHVLSLVTPTAARVIINDTFVFTFFLIDSALTSFSLFFKVVWLLLLQRLWFWLLLRLLILDRSLFYLILSLILVQHVSYFCLICHYNCFIVITLSCQVTVCILSRESVIATICYCFDVLFLWAVQYTAIKGRLSVF